MDEESIFTAALDIDLAEMRAAYLARICAGDADLRQRVDELLQAHDQAGSLLEELAGEWCVSRSACDDRPLAEQPGGVIDRYRLLEKIAEGGMGVVYVAEQLQPVRRQVALKIIKPGMDTYEVIRRFEAERQAVALMDHANIAKALDAGATESGRPYFVMELVRGVPITDYCDSNMLSTRERLELLVQVCGAVQHAHQKGIIHRDIKPSNVMVTLCDGAPVPKVIDFGVAKAIDQRLTDGTAHTRFAQLVGTPLYMSPEQAGASALDIDTRSDIYSLGVLLYELLTGTTPFEGQRLRHAAYDEMLRIIREEEPPKPSTRINSLGDMLASVAHNRHTEPRKLRAMVRGDLDWIVMKALEKDRRRRYATAHELATDVQRYLADQPVEARPPSRAYRLRKLVRRNKLMAASTVCILAAAVVAASFALVAHRRWIREVEARLALQQAEDQRLQAHVNALVEEALRLGSGDFPGFPRAVKLLTDAIGHRPNDARLYLYRGSALFELGRHQEAIADLERSLQLGNETSPAAHWLIAMASQHLGNDEKTRLHRDLASQRDPESVELLVLQALAMPYDERGIELLTEAIRREPFNPMTYYYRGRIAYNLTGRKTAKRFYDMAVDDLEKAILGRPGDPRIVEALCRCLVKYHFLAGGPDQPLSRAKQLADEWLAAEPDNCSAMLILGDWCLATGQPEAVIDICEKASQIEPQMPEFLFLRGWAHRKLGQHEQAVSSLSQALSLPSAAASLEEQRGHVAGYAGRAMSHFALGRKDLARQDLSRAPMAMPPQNWTYFDWYTLISAYRALGEYQEGLQWTERYVEQAPESSAAHFWRGTLLTDLGRDEEGCREFIRALEVDPHNSSAYIVLLSVYLKLKKHDAALEQCQNWLRAAPESSDPYRWRGLFHYELGKFEDARRDFDEALRRNRDDARAYYHRARTKVALKQYDSALADFDKALELDGDDADAYLVRGRLHFDRTQYEQAAADFSRALKYRPNDAPLYRCRGEAFQKLGRFDDALVDLGRAIESNPQDATAYDRRGLVYAGQKRYEEAIGQHARALDINPHEPWAHLHFVEAYLAKGDYQGAIRRCDQWHEAEPGSSEPLRLRGVAHRSSGNLQAALDAFGEALATDPNAAAVYVERARVYSKLGQPARALADFNRALELKPGYQAVYYSRGLANAELRRYQQAVDDLSRAIQFNAPQSWLYYHRSKAYRALGRYEEAMADCDKAIKLDPAVATFHLYRGSILAAQNDLGGALSQYRRAFELNPQEPFARQSIVNTLCATKDYDAASAFCDRWRRDEPNSAEACRQQGFVHYGRGEYGKAIEAYDRALQRDPHDHRALFHRGQAHLAMNDSELGEADVTKSFQVCPDSQAAEHCGVVGEFYGELGQWKQAAAALSKAVEFDPNNVLPWHLLAVAQLASGDDRAYRRTCERMLQHYGWTEDPNTAELVALTGVLRDGVGDAEQLVALANQAAESRPANASCRCILGAVLYRAGRFPDALNHLIEADRLTRQAPSAEPTLAARVSCLLAMTHHRLGNKEAALEQLREASTDKDDQVKEARPFSPDPPAWSQRLITDGLRQEAEELIASP